VATGERPPVANGAPVANGPGGNRDPGLVANKTVDTVAPGWRLMNCRPELQKSVNLLGKTNVLQTYAEGTARLPTLRRQIDATRDSSLKAIVGHAAGDSWNLVIKVDGNQVETKAVSAETSKEGWTEVTMDFSAFAGKSVLVELVAVGGAEGALWSEVSLK